MKINIIVAVDNNWLIGVNGQIPWNSPADMKRFKELTTGHAVIMGHRTWGSLPVKPLPNRKNFVVARNFKPGMYQNPDTVFTESTLGGAIGWAELIGEEEVFIIGGARLYEEALPIADRVYTTRIDTTYSIAPDSGDESVYFPFHAFKVKDWELMRWERSDKEPRVTFQIYDRRRG